jgi:hypothetical protein
MREVVRCHRIRLFSVLGIITLVAGCSKSRNESLPQLYPVRGRVQCDGVPLANGEISFGGADDAGLALAPAVASIIDGNYETVVAEGRKTVQISSPIEVGEADVTGVRATKETIAPDFNTKSTIVVEISPAEGNEFDFDVKSR